MLCIRLCAVASRKHCDFENPERARGSKRKGQKLLKTSQKKKSSQKISLKISQKTEDITFTLDCFCKIFAQDCFILRVFSLKLFPENTDRNIAIQTGASLVALYCTMPETISAITPYCARWGFWCLNMANCVRYPLPLF